MSFKTKAIALASATLFGIGLIGGTALAAYGNTQVILANGTGGCSASVTGGTVDFGTWTWAPQTGAYVAGSTGHTTFTLQVSMTAPNGSSTSGHTCTMTVSGSDLSDGAAPPHTIASSNLGLSAASDAGGGSTTEVNSLPNTTSGTPANFITGAKQVITNATSTVTLMTTSLNSLPDSTYTGTITITGSGQHP